MSERSIPDPNGAAERPECGAAQQVADDLRRLASSDTNSARKAAMIAAAEMLELQLDWLLEQHRIINQLQGIS